MYWTGGIYKIESSSFSILESYAYKKTSPKKILRRGYVLRREALGALPCLGLQSGLHGC